VSLSLKPGDGRPARRRPSTSSTALFQIDIDLRVIEQTSLIGLVGHANGVAAVDERDLHAMVGEGRAPLFNGRIAAADHGDFSCRGKKKKAVGRSRQGRYAGRRGICLRWGRAEPTRLGAGGDRSVHRSCKVTPLVAAKHETGRRLQVDLDDVSSTICVPNMLGLCACIWFHEPGTLDGRWRSLEKFSTSVVIDIWPPGLHAAQKKRLQIGGGAA